MSGGNTPRRRQWRNSEQVSFEIVEQVILGDQVGTLPTQHQEKEVQAFAMYSGMTIKATAKLLIVLSVRSGLY